MEKLEGFFGRKAAEYSAKYEENSEEWVAAHYGFFEEDNQQKVIVQITQDGDKITVSTTFTPDIDFANPNETPATKWAALFLNTLVKN